jgi:peptidoglycan/LPS O-acetylase OafA/YrhL
MMNQLNLTTPALLFSAISLLLLAYTNRFLAYAQVVRNLHARFKENPDSLIIGQIQNLRKRLVLTRTMQLLGIGSLLLCVLCMFLVYVEFQLAAEIIFGIALVMLIISLAISIREIQISVKALDLHLSDMEL